MSLIVLVPCILFSFDIFTNTYSNASIMATIPFILSPIGTLRNGPTVLTPEKTNGIIKKFL
jgi:hypothetical protein